MKLYIAGGVYDHCGALQWIIDRGFVGKIISTEETKSQIGIEYPHWTTFSFNEGSDRTTIDVDDISVISGMSGHCIGSVKEFEQGSVQVGMAMSIICVLFSTTALVMLNCAIDRNKK